MKKHDKGIIEIIADILIGIGMTVLLIAIIFIVIYTKEIILLM